MVLNRIIRGFYKSLICGIERKMMMLKKRIKQGSVFGLAFALTFSGFVLSKVYAATAIKTDEKCTVQIDLKNSGFTELTGPEALSVEVGLYKVADIDISGNYTALPDYDTLDFSVIDSETTPEVWSALAKAVKEEILSDEIEALVTKKTQYGEAIMDNLETGMYLVDVQQILSDDYIYDFTPFLVSLPNNYYFVTGDDTWVYDLVGENAVSLKATKTERLGDLVINKVLDTYNESVGGATFVFQIEATKTNIDADADDPEKTKVVYSDVVSMTFNGTGEDSIMIKDLPAGADVTVTEVYSGASYKVTTDAAKTVKILAEEAVSTDFENTYDNRLNGGSGVVNSFLYDSETKEWVPVVTEDSTP